MVRDHQALVRQYVRDNLERGQDLVNDQVRYQVGDHFLLVMVAQAEVEQVAVITPALRSEVEADLVAHALVVQVELVEVVDQVQEAADQDRLEALLDVVEKVARPIANRNRVRLGAKRSIIYGRPRLVAR